MDDTSLAIEYGSLFHSLLHGPLSFCRPCRRGYCRKGGCGHVGDVAATVFRTRRCFPKPLRQVFGSRFGKDGSALRPGRAALLAAALSVQAAHNRRTASRRVHFTETAA